MSKHVILTFFFAIALCPAAALAVPMYSVNLTGVTPVSNSLSPVTLQSNVITGTGGHIQGIATAGSRLGAKIDASQTATGLNNGIFVQTDSNLTSIFDDIVFTGPGSGLITATIHIPFHAVVYQSYGYLEYFEGGHDTSYVDQGIDLDATLQSVNGRLVISGFNEALGNVSITPSTSPGASIVGHSSNTDPIGDGSFLNRVADVVIPIMTPPNFEPAGAGNSVQDIITLSGEFNLTSLVSLNTPETLVLQMNLTTIAAGGNNGLLSSDGEIDAFHTFGLENGQIAFDLPDGYTVNSPSLNIANNVVVPEPSSLVLAAFGLAGLPAWAWRRHVACVVTA